MNAGLVNLLMLLLLLLVLIVAAVAAAHGTMGQWDNGPMGQLMHADNIPHGLSSQYITFYTYILMSVDVWTTFPKDCQVLTYFLYLFIDICIRLDDIPEGLSSPFIILYTYLLISAVVWTTFPKDCQVLT